jgi:hypothetical protein
MTANALGAVIRHEADDETAGHRDEYGEPTQMVIRRRDQCLLTGGLSLGMPKDGVEGTGQFGTGPFEFGPMRHRQLS